MPLLAAAQALAHRLSSRTRGIRIARRPARRQRGSRQRWRDRPDRGPPGGANHGMVPTGPGWTASSSHSVRRDVRTGFAARDHAAAWSTRTTPSPSATSRTVAAYCAIRSGVRAPRAPEAGSGGPPWHPRPGPAERSGRAGSGSPTPSSSSFMSLVPNMTNSTSGANRPAASGTQREDLVSCCRRRRS